MMCAMRITIELSYDAPPADVFAMLADPAFRERVCEAQQTVSHDVGVEMAGAGMTVTVETVQNTAGLPSIAKKVVGDTTRAILTETWKDGSGGTVQIAAPGKPTGASGTVRLVEDGAGSTEVVELDVKVKVPLVGGKLEQLMAETIREAYDVEHSVGREWLAGTR